MAEGKDKPKSPDGADAKPSSLTETDGIDWFIMSDFNDLLSGNSSTTLQPSKPATSSAAKLSQPSSQMPVANSASTNQGNPFASNDDDDDAAWLAALDLDAPAVSDLSGKQTVLITPLEPQQPQSNEVASPEDVDWLIMSNLGESPAATNVKVSASYEVFDSTSPSKTATSDLGFDFGSTAGDKFLAEFGSGFDDDLAQGLADDFFNEAALENLGVSDESDLALEDLDHSWEADLAAISPAEGDNFAALMAADSLGTDINEDLALLLADQIADEILAEPTNPKEVVPVQVDLASDHLNSVNSEVDAADEFLMGFSDEMEMIAPADPIAPLDDGESMDEFSSAAAAKSTPVAGSSDNIWSTDELMSGGDDLSWQSEGDAAPWDQPIVTPAIPQNAADQDPLDTAVVFDFNQFSSTFNEAEDWLHTHSSNEPPSRETPDEFGDMVWHIPSTNDDDFGDTVVTAWIDPSDRDPAKSKSFTPEADPFASDWNAPSPPQSNVIPEAKLSPKRDAELSQNYHAPVVAAEVEPLSDLGGDIDDDYDEFNLSELSPVATDSANSNLNSNLANMVYDLGAESQSNSSEINALDFWENEVNDMLTSEGSSFWDSAQIDQNDQSNYLDSVANEFFQDAPSLSDIAPEQPSLNSYNADISAQLKPPQSNVPSSQLTTLYTPDHLSIDDDFNDELGHDLADEFDQIGSEPSNYNNYQEFIAPSAVAPPFNSPKPPDHHYPSPHPSGAPPNPTALISRQSPQPIYAPSPDADGGMANSYIANEADIDLADFDAVLADDFIPSDYLGSDHLNSEHFNGDNFPDPLASGSGNTGLMAASSQNVASTYEPSHEPPHYLSSSATHLGHGTNPPHIPINPPMNPPMGNIDNDYLDNFDLDEFDSSVGNLGSMPDTVNPSSSQFGTSSYEPPASSPAQLPLPLPPLPKMPPLPHPPAASGHSAISKPATPRRPTGNSNTAFDDDFLRNASRASMGHSGGMNAEYTVGGSPVLSDFNDIGSLDIRDDTDWTGLLDGDSELSDSFTAMPVSSYAPPQLPDQSGFFTGATDDLPRHRQPPLAMPNTGLTGFGTGPRPTPTPQIADNFKAAYGTGVGNTGPGAAKDKDSERPNLPVSISLEAIWDKAKWPIVGLILLGIGGGGMMLLQRPYTEFGLKFGFIKDASGKNLQGSNFKDAKLENVNFSGANLEAAVFENANLKGANLSEAKLDGVNFAKANLRSARLLRTSIIWANFKGAQLNWADLEEAEVTRSNFAGATLEGANLRGMKLGEGDKMARLEPKDRLMWQLVNEAKPGRNLAGQNLTGFNLNGATLTGANLTNSQLSFVDLTGADLKNANLSGAIVKGMNLSGAKLNGAQFTGAVWDKGKPPKTDAATVCPNGKPGPCKF